VKRLQSLCAVIAFLLAGSAFADPCDSGQLGRTMVEKLRARHLLDVHGLALVAQSLCPASPERFAWATWDALALEDLDEPLRAQALLHEVATTAPAPERDRAAVLLTWLHLRQGDTAAFEGARTRLASADATRLAVLAALDDRDEFAKRLALLPEARRGQTSTHYAEYQHAHVRRPWLAGVMSGVLPGAGQAYAGSWQGAAVAFVLNAALIGATAELATRRLYFSAAAAGTAASVFYVGNILNAADLAQRRNERASAPARESIERLLIPEAYP
jgi:hypothetical protein